MESFHSMRKCGGTKSAQGDVSDRCERTVEGYHCDARLQNLLTAENLASCDYERPTLADNRIRQTIEPSE